MSAGTVAGTYGGDSGWRYFVVIGSYLFAGGVYEITPHPRPASREFADDVETDHPRESFLRRAAVTLWSFEGSQMQSTRALQDTTDAAPRAFPGLSRTT